MRRIDSIIILVLLSLNLTFAQRFSLLTEVGATKTQVDGDKIQGFYYNGYTAGIGTNYAFNDQNFISVKTAYFDQGSRRKNKFLPKPRTSIQLRLDFSTVGLELSYKHKPRNKNYYVGIGVVRHQIISLEYAILTQIKKDINHELSTGQVKGSFNSVKTYYGYKLFNKASIYIASQISLTNLLRTSFNGVNSLIPYTIELVCSYEIIASKVDKFKSRPGSKTRNKPVIKATNKT